MHTQSKYLSFGLGAVALCASILPAAASSWTPPGGTMGSPAGAVPPPGLYFANAAYYGIGTLPGGATKAVGVEVPIFIWSSGWNFLGASYAASVGFALVDVGIRTPGHLADTYLRAPFNPYINPITLSWNLGNGFFVSLGEGLYVPINTEVTVPPNGGFTTGASFETRGAVSYIDNDWIASVNGILGITTNGQAGVKTPDYFNVDWTVAHTFGRWELGVVGYGAWDLQSVPIVPGLAPQSSRAVQVGIGGLLGYNVGSVDIVLEASHQVVTHGTFTDFGKNDTRVWTTIVVPIWNPATPTAPKPLVAKY